ncbi:hypothetical protein AB0J52_24955 [Spirillospora sp. NPDC049652]
MVGHPGNRRENARMLFFGLILAAAAVALGAAVVVFDTGPAHLTLFDRQVPGITSLWQVFLAGAGTAVLFVLAMIMLWVGFGRMLTNRRDLRDSLTTLEMEKKELQDQLARARARRGDRPDRPDRPDAPGRPDRGGPDRDPRSDGPVRPVRGDGPVRGGAAGRGDGPQWSDAPAPVGAGVGPVAGSAHGGDGSVPGADGRAQAPGRRRRRASSAPAPADVPAPAGGPNAGPSPAPGGAGGTSRPGGPRIDAASPFFDRAD